ENYFNYFTEIEERFQKRRGTGLLLSTLDWALIETWKDAGIPVEAVLSGIDVTFDKYDRRPSKTRKVNTLAYCAQEVLAAAEDLKEAAIGTGRQATYAAPGMSAAEVAAYFRRNAEGLAQAELPVPAKPVALECARALAEMADALMEAEVMRGQMLGQALPVPFSLENMELHLTVLEEKLLAALTVAASEADLAALYAEADRAIMPYRSKMPGFQIEQLKKQFVHKRVFEKAKIPRLSLFYM